MSMLFSVYNFPRCPNYGHRGRTEISVEEEWKHIEDLLRVFLLSMPMEKLLSIFSIIFLYVWLIVLAASTEVL